MVNITITFIGLLILVSFVPGVDADIIGYWPLDGDASSCIGTDGILHNSPVPVSDRHGNVGGALSFDGNNQYVEFIGGGGLDGLTTGSVSMWVKWVGPQQKDCCGSVRTYGPVLARQGDGLFSDNIIALDDPDPNQAVVVWRQSGTPAEPLLYGTTVVGNDIWHHVVVTFTPGISQLFVDGVLQDVSSTGAPMHSNSTVPLALGAWSGDGNAFSVSFIDDMVIWDTVLSQAQIIDLFNGAPVTDTLFCVQRNIDRAMRAKNEALPALSKARRQAKSLLSVQVTSIA